MNRDRKNRQRGLAAVELVLIAPILMSICYLILNIASTASLWEQRIVASRNAAYRTEIYYGGNPTGLDNFFNQAETLLGVIARGAPDQAAALNIGNKVKRYSITKENELYEELVDDSRDRTKNPYMVPAVIKDLTSKLDDQSLDSTTGVGWSLYESPVGRLGNMFLEIERGPVIRLKSVLREKHTADFAQTLDLSTTPDLCLGYDEKMHAFLQPKNLFTKTLPRDKSRCQIPAWVPLPNLPAIPNGLPAFSVR